MAIAAGAPIIPVVVSEYDFLDYRQTILFLCLSNVFTLTLPKENPDQSCRSPKNQNLD